MRNWFKKFIFKQIVGIEIDHFHSFAQFLLETDEKINEIQAQQILINKTLKKISKQTGGPGWTKIIQHAIENLDEKIIDINDTLESHQDIFDEIIDAQDIISVTSFKDSDIN